MRKEVLISIAPVLKGMGHMAVCITMSHVSPCLQAMFAHVPIHHYIYPQLFNEHLLCLHQCLATTVGKGRSRKTC